TTVPGEGWTVTSPETVGDFTAVGYYFARSVREHHPDVPIGILHSSWGGSRIEAWLDAGAQGLLDTDELLAAERQQIEQAQQRVVNKLKTIYPQITTEDPGLKAEWWRTNSNWNQQEPYAYQVVPGTWEANGYPDFDGIAWYRTSFQLTAAEAAAGVTVHLGQIDDADITWLNDQEIGRMDNAYNVDRVYEVPAALLREGKNVLTVRVEDYGWGGGFRSAAAAVFVQTAEQKIPLAGQWQFSPGAYRVAGFAQKANKLPTLLYNAMIHPLLRCKLRGFCWYQGESNASLEADAQKYAKQFQSLIRWWREDWGQGDLPFLFVQLANFGPEQSLGPDDHWPTLRQSQQAALSLPNTHQALAIDIGEADDIHPKNKQEVGRRLALGARALAYGEDIAYESPRYQSVTGEKYKLLLHFTVPSTELSRRATLAEGVVRGFEVAGEDGRFRRATAILHQQELRIWTGGITNPRYLRYAWRQNPGPLHLYTNEGLPVAPFSVSLKKD
ncbi:MAG: sialate O-acetylesterase, partial [Bacteroidota bacterium]